MLTLKQSRRLNTLVVGLFAWAVALLQFDVGMASAGGLIAVVIANIAAIILVRMLGKNLTEKY